MMTQELDTADIMIVDDAPANLKLLEGMLRAQGYNTRALPQGRLALKAAANDPPDLILLDINMPEMNGYEVCQQLKQSPHTKDIPVIFISTLEKVEDKVAAFTSGGVDYITKPFQFEEVQARVETHLEIRRMQAKLAMHNQRLQELVQEQVRDILETKEELSQAQHATIQAMSKIADSRDNDTGRHIERTQSYCHALAVHLRQEPACRAQIDDEFLENIRNASPLHDIGKVAIPDAVLQKPGKLTPDEFEIIKAHTTIGAQNLMAVLASHPNNAFVAMGVSIAKYHHEKWNGSGYPEGLAGDDIPLTAQIMAVADVYDALRCERCYKKGFSHKQSTGIILADAATHFAPTVCEAFSEIEGEFNQISERLSDE